MTDTQAKVSPAAGFRHKILTRALSVLLAAAALGFIVNRATALMNNNGGPAGFGRGVLQGALMPCALPNLLVGNDVPIYDPNNTGRTYKLGYTVGVNGCGAVFFGIFFWRVSRWRRRIRAGM